MTIPYITTCTFDWPSGKELLFAGFNDSKEAFEGMQLYYPDLQKDSIVSYYYFGNHRAKPSRKLLEIVLKQMNQ